MSDKARYLEVDRARPGWEMVDFDALLAGDHRARVVWSFVSGLALSALYERIKAREGEPGRPPPDPRLLLAPWLYATLEGVGSARELARSCERDLAYRWLCGGVAVNCHGLGDFRVGHAAVLDRPLTESLTALVASGVVTLSEVAVDGTKVRAGAGKGSFRRAGRLARIEQAARERVARPRRDADIDPACGARRRQAARRRAARDIADRAAAASDELRKLRAETAAATHRAKEAPAPDEPRASRTGASGPARPASPRTTS